MIYTFFMNEIHKTQFSGNFLKNFCEAASWQLEQSYFQRQFLKAVFALQTTKNIFFKGGCQTYHLKLFLKIDIFCVLMKRIISDDKNKSHSSEMNISEQSVGSFVLLEIVIFQLSGEKFSSIILRKMSEKFLFF